MDNATLAGCRAKVARCDELLQQLADKWRAFLDTNPWPSRIEDGPDPGWYTVYFDFTAEPPPSLSVVVGEVAHNLRSALDHLVWREAVEYLRREPTREEARGIAFPIAWKKADYRSSPTLRHLSKDAAALVEQSQPYKCADAQEAASLGVIHWYNRLDKHQALHVTAAAAPHVGTNTQLFLTSTPGSQLVAIRPFLAPRERLSGNTKVISVQFASGGPEPNVTVQGVPAVEPSFGQLPAKLHGASIEKSIAITKEITDRFAILAS